MFRSLAKVPADASEAATLLAIGLSPEAPAFFREVLGFHSSVFIRVRRARGV